MKKIGIATALFICMLAAGCDKQTTDKSFVHDITGTWVEYAYLCSDGYFVRVDDAGYAVYYIFNPDGSFENYSINTGYQSLSTVGTWKFSTITNAATVTTDTNNWWNISFEFDENDGDLATMTVIKRSGSTNTIKARRQ